MDLILFQHYQRGVGFYKKDAYHQGFWIMGHFKPAGYAIAPRTKNGFTDGWQRYEYGALSECNEWQDLEENVFETEGCEEKDKSSHILVVWRKVVKAYTHRNLSIPTDRIIAISALAHRIGDRLQDQYLAGLWRSRFPFELLWHMDEIFNSSRGTLALRPEKYQGPSWSWVAVNSAVDFFEQVSSKKCSDCVSILNVEIRLSEASAEYGSVDFGIVRLKGPVKEAVWNVGRCLKCKDGALLEDYMWPDALESEFVEENNSEISESTPASDASNIDVPHGSRVSEAEEDTGDALQKEKWIGVLLLKVCTRNSRKGKTSFRLVLRDCGERDGSLSVMTCTRLGVSKIFIRFQGIRRLGQLV